MPWAPAAPHIPPEAPSVPQLMATYAVPFPLLASEAAVEVRRDQFSSCPSELLPVRCQIPVFVSVSDRPASKWKCCKRLALTTGHSGAAGVSTNWTFVQSWQFVMSNCTPLNIASVEPLHSPGEPPMRPDRAAALTLGTHTSQRAIPYCCVK